MSAVDLIQAISCLPKEIKNKIYKEYFEPELIYNKYTFVLHRELGKALDPSLGLLMLRELLPNILSNKLVIKMLCNRCKIFRDVYNSHKLNNNKKFVKLKNGNSFALEILCYLY